MRTDYYLEKSKGHWRGVRGRACGKRMGEELVMGLLRPSWNIREGSFKLKIFNRFWFARFPLAEIFTNYHNNNCFASLAICLWFAITAKILAAILPILSSLSFFRNVKFLSLFFWQDHLAGRWRKQANINNKEEPVPNNRKTMYWVYTCIMLGEYEMSGEEHKRRETHAERKRRLQ